MAIQILKGKSILPHLLLLGALSGCAEGTDDMPTADRGDLNLVMPGKADDYFSNVSKEFEVQGVIEVQMTEDEFNEVALRERLIAQRISAVGVYLTTYLTDKFRGIDINGDGEIGDDEVFFNNTEYGGFKAMVRNRSTETIDILEGQDGEYHVGFTIDVAGPNNLLEMLVADGGTLNDFGVNLNLQMPAGASTSQDGGPIRSFDPSTYEGELETINLDVVTLPEVYDAYPAYKEFMEDGLFEITMVFGHDYNAARYDILDAQQAFDVLVADGFSAPVDSFDKLTADSGTFEKQIISFRTISDTCAEDHIVATLNGADLTDDQLKAMGMRSDARRNTFTHRNGDDGEFGTADDIVFTDLDSVDSIYRVGPKTLEKMQNYYAQACSTRQVDVTIKVRIFHSDMYIGNRDAQREQTLFEFVHRDVIFYNGHAGPYYGFYLDAEYGAYIDDADFASIPFDENKQQLFVAQGCQTYSQYADMLYANPAKNEGNLDVITTVNYSYARGTMDLFRRLVQTDDYEANVHNPATFNDMLTNLNAEEVNSAYTVFYGVIGIDQNEKLSPYALPETVGTECVSHQECGDTFNGNLCVGFTDGVNRCVARTSTESGCPNGTTYAYVASEQYVVGGVCWAM